MCINKMGFTLEAHQKSKRHGKFRYWTNRRYKDLENLRRIQKILAQEAKERSM